LRQRSGKGLRRSDQELIAKEKSMKKRITYALSLCCLSAILALAQGAAGMEGTWITEGVPVVEAAKKAKKSVSGLPEGTRIRFRVDVRRNRVSGTITQLNTDKEYEIEDGKLADKTFTFRSVEVVSIGFGNFGNRGGASNTPQALSWRGELTDADTVTLTQLSPAGEPTGVTLVLKRAPK
jgi:hypothetical protein